MMKIGLGKNELTINVLEEVLGTDLMDKSEKESQESDDFGTSEG